MIWWQVAGGVLGLVAMLVTIGMAIRTILRSAGEDATKLTAAISSAVAEPMQELRGAAVSIAVVQVQLGTVLQSIAELAAARGATASGLAELRAGFDGLREVLRAATDSIHAEVERVRVTVEKIELRVSSLERSRGSSGRMAAHTPPGG